ncbi:MAG: type II CAAX prenyl endopeptidase Rce1 family protein [Aquificaceae bacterium]
MYSLFNLSFSAFAEELFFRGFLMRRYSNLIVSFLFMFPHLLLYQNLLSALTFFPSLLFGLIYKKTDSLIFVSMVHVFSNVLYRIIIKEYAHS